MKKLFCLIGLVLTASASAAEEKPANAEKKSDLDTACCTRTASSGTPNTPGYVSVTVTKCLGGKTHNDASVSACANAQTAAQNAVKALADTTVTIYPTN